MPACACGRHLLFVVDTSGICGWQAIVADLCWFLSLKREPLLVSAGQLPSQSTSAHSHPLRSNIDRSRWVSSFSQAAKAAEHRECQRSISELDRASNRRNPTQPTQTHAQQLEAQVAQQQAAAAETLDSQQRAEVQAQAPRDAQQRVRSFPCDLPLRPSLSPS